MERRAVLVVRPMRETGGYARFCCSWLSEPCKPVWLTSCSLAAHAKFTGAVSFPNREDAQAFNRAVNEFLDSATHVYFEIAKNPMYHLTVLGHAKALLALCENFELNAIHFDFKESQRRCHDAYAELSGHVADLEHVLLEPRPNLNRWTLAQGETAHGAFVVLRIGV